MNKVRKKFSDLEKKQKEISEKLDKYEYDFNNEQKKANDIKDITFNNNNKINFESCAKIDKDYQKVLDKRLDEIMGKINDNIINQNYLNFYEFLLNGRPKYNKSSYYNTEKKNKNDNDNKKIINSNDNNVSTKSNKKRNSKLNKKKENENGKEIDNSNINNSINNNNNNNSINNINSSSNNKNNINNKKYEEHVIGINNNINNNNNNKFNINEINNSNNDNDNNNNDNNKMKLNNVPQKANIYLSYNGPGKINLEDAQNQENLELLHKQQNIFLGNELTLLKCKLNKIRKENEFLQSLIHDKGMVKNTNVLEKFIGGFVEKLSLNWNDIVEQIIDEIIVDEIHELNEIELNKVNYEKNKNKIINNLFSSELGGIIPEKTEDDYANIDLLLGNVEQIKRILNSVKESENNIRAKYNL